MKLKTLSLLCTLGLLILGQNVLADKKPAKPAAELGGIPASCTPPEASADGVRKCLIDLLSENICTLLPTDNLSCQAACAAATSGQSPGRNDLACCLDAAKNTSAGQSVKSILHPLCDVGFNRLVCAVPTAQTIAGYLCCPLNSSDVTHCLSSAGGCGNYTPTCSSTSIKTLRNQDRL
jgi:hypothetical protein